MERPSQHRSCFQAHRNVATGLHPDSGPANRHEATIEEPYDFWQLLVSCTRVVDLDYAAHRSGVAIVNPCSNCGAAAVARFITPDDNKAIGVVKTGNVGLAAVGRLGLRRGGGRRIAAELAIPAILVQVRNDEMNLRVGAVSTS